MCFQTNSSNHPVYQSVRALVPALGQGSVPASGQVSVRALVPALGQASVPALGQASVLASEQASCRMGPLQSCTQRAEQAQSCGRASWQAVVQQVCQFRTQLRPQDKMILEPAPTPAR